MSDFDFKSPDLNDFFSLIDSAKKEKKEKLEELVSNSFDEYFWEKLKEDITPKKKKIKKKKSSPTVSLIGRGEPPPTPTIAEENNSLIEKSLGLLAEPNDTKQQNDPLTPLNQNFATLEDLNKHYNLFLSRIQQQLSTLGGGGETRFEFLDDVNRNSVKVDNHYIKFDETTGKFIGSQIVDDNYTTQIEPQGDDNVVSVINLPNSVIGPVQGFVFDTTHEHTTKNPGTLCWNDEDDTLNIQHSNDVIQQVGQELYLRVRNETGSTILNGTTVRFAGTSNGGGEARITAAPFLANGTFPSLYTIGVATQDIEDDEEGFITVFGKVRDLNTTGVGVTETWGIGDILYANPTVAGALTKVKPTAPNNVIPVAAIVKVDATQGEIFVRPTIDQKYSYGLFERTTDLSVVGINTAYVIPFDTTEISNGVGIGTTSSQLKVDQSGLYKIDISAQIDSSDSGLQGATMFMWVRKNGNDVTDSTRRQGIVGVAPSTNMSFSVNISLNANDYIEVAYAGDNNTLRFDAATATAFAPSTAAVKVTVTQEVL